MDDFASPSTCFISARVRHRVATLTVREDVLIAVRRGSKTLLGSAASSVIAAGECVVMARGSQWDVINDPAGDGRYEALVLQFGDRAITRFHAMYAGEFSLPAVESCCVLSADAELDEAVDRAADAIASAHVSPLLRQHRSLETLLLLAERGCVLRPRAEVSWPDQLRRLIGNRPYADWTIDSLARACHLSASTLRRRLGEYGLTVGGLVREVRLEIAMSLLQTTELPIGEVAQRCGYGSHSRFTAAFRARYGYAPSDLRAGR